MKKKTIECVWTAAVFLLGYYACKLDEAIYESGRRKGHQEMAEFAIDTCEKLKNQILENKEENKAC